MRAPGSTRPTAVKQTRYEWVYLYAAIEPATGARVALQAPNINTGTMDVFLKMLADELGPKNHAVLIMDQAGRHKGKQFKVPNYVWTLCLPPHRPEVNPVERLWAYLRSHYLANRTISIYQHLLDAGANGWQPLTPELLRSVCACPSLPRDPKRRSA